MNNNNNEFRKMIANLENKGNMVLQKMKSTSECSEYSKIWIDLWIFLTNNIHIHSDKKK